MKKSLEEIDQLSVTEFHEWMLYEHIEPFGDRRGDIQAGVIASTIANVYRSDSRPPYKIMDLIPPWEQLPETKHEQTPEEQLAFLRALQKRQKMGRA